MPSIEPPDKATMNAPVVHETENDPEKFSVSFIAVEGAEMLKIKRDGFYVRGVKLQQDEDEAKQVWEAFTAWIVNHGLDTAEQVRKENERLKTALSETIEENAALKDSMEDRRRSLAREIDGCLKARGFHSPGTAVPADLICAVGRALDGSTEYARAQNAALVEAERGMRMAYECVQKGHNDEALLHLGAHEARVRAALNREPSVVIDNKGAGSALLPAVPPAGWIPVAAGLPDNAEHVLIATKTWHDAHDAIRHGGGWNNLSMGCDHDDAEGEVTHWMPKPANPNSERNDLRLAVNTECDHDGLRTFWTGACRKCGAVNVTGTEP